MNKKPGWQKLAEIVMTTALCVLQYSQVLDVINGVADQMTAFWIVFNSVAICGYIVSINRK